VHVCPAEQGDDAHGDDTPITDTAIAAKHSIIHIEEYIYPREQSAHTSHEVYLSTSKRTREMSL
jgi:hypothetical protein